MKRLHAKFAMLSLLALGFGAQAQTTPTSPTGMNPPSKTQPADSGMGHNLAMPSDNQIADIMKTANDAEVDAARLAQKRAANADVKKFAEHMVVEHTQNLKDAKVLEKKIDVKPVDSDAKKALKSDTKDKYADLKKTKGGEFDKMYINQQVAMHQQLLNDLDHTFIPSAQNPQLKEFLQTTRSHVQEHLTEAQNIQTSLSK